MEIGMAQQKVFSDCPLHRLHIWSQLHISWAHYNRRKFATPLGAFRVSPFIGVGKGEKIGIVRPKQWVLWQLP
jgi:hypothetical protein